MFMFSQLFQSQPFPRGPHTFSEGSYLDPSGAYIKVSEGMWIHRVWDLAGAVCSSLRMTCGSLFRQNAISCSSQFDGPFAAELATVSMV